MRPTPLVCIASHRGHGFGGQPLPFGRITAPAAALAQTNHADVASTQHRRRCEPGISHELHVEDVQVLLPVLSLAV